MLDQGGKSSDLKYQEEEKKRKKKNREAHIK
jgi:hypothetical protein